MEAVGLIVIKPFMQTSLCSALNSCVLSEMLLFLSSTKCGHLSNFLWEREFSFTLSKLSFLVNILRSMRYVKWQILHWELIQNVLNVLWSLSELLFCQSKKLILSQEATQDLLLCLLWVLKNVDQRVLRNWWSDLSVGRLNQFLEVIYFCVSNFEYKVTIWIFVQDNGLC